LAKVTGSVFKPKIALTNFAIPSLFIFGEGHTGSVFKPKNALTNFAIPSLVFFWRLISTKQERLPEIPLTSIAIPSFVFVGA